MLRALDLLEQNLWRIVNCVQRRLGAQAEFDIQGVLVQI